MFDLIDECGKELKKHGYIVRNYANHDVSVASLQIESKEKSLLLGLRQGQYYIISCPFLYEKNLEYISKIVERKFIQLLNKQKIKEGDKILLACLGNPDVDGDRLGKEVFDRVDVMSYKKNLYKFCPNIFLYTGIETADIIKILTKELKIKCVVIIDSLMTNSLNRLGTSFQLSTGGMTPGSGINRFGKAIDEDELNAKCITIGVPFMIKSSSLKENEKEIVLVPKDIKLNIALAGEIIAQALRRAIK